MAELHRNAVKSFAYLNILIELSKGKKLSGYDILVHLKNFGLEVSPGTIYHQLSMLTKQGIIKGEKETRKTVYQMTDKGHRAFNKFKRKWRKPIAYAYEHIYK